MSQTSKAQYLENCRQRYLSRNRQGKSAMIDEVSDTMGWERKHAIKALNRKVSLGNRAKKRGAKPSYGKEEITVIVAIWKSSEQPCGVRLKATLPLWLDSYEARHGSLTDKCREKILHYGPRTLERITAPYRSAGSGRIGRKTGRSSNRIKQFVPIRCGPQEFDASGWLEADTVSHGGGIEVVGATVELTNCIVANSLGADTFLAGPNSMLNLIGKNLIESGMASAGVLTMDPILGELSKLGGTTPTYFLPSSSPVINAGVNAFAANLATDQRGVGLHTSHRRRSRSGCRGIRRGFAKIQCLHSCAERECGSAWKRPLHKTHRLQF
ncbi:MAG: hypothetical protein HC767_05090 [Akkermansiaceae bacterium]|nr:hypothetical protein [Akkermansiaceae bacterium]